MAAAIAASLEENNIEDEKNNSFNQQYLQNQIHEIVDDDSEIEDDVNYNNIPPLKDEPSGINIISRSIYNISFLIYRIRSR